MTPLNKITKIKFNRIIKNKFSSKHMSASEMNNLSKEYTFFSWSAQNKIAPIAMEKAKGCYFWDADGKKYFDMNPS